MGGRSQSGSGAEPQRVTLQCRLSTRLLPRGPCNVLQCTLCTRWPRLCPSTSQPSMPPERWSRHHSCCQWSTPCTPTQPSASCYWCTYPLGRRVVQSPQADSRSRQRNSGRWSALPRSGTCPRCTTCRPPAPLHSRKCLCRTPSHNCFLRRRSTRPRWPCTGLTTTAQPLKSSAQPCRAVESSHPRGRSFQGCRCHTPSWWMPSGMCQRHKPSTSLSPLTPCMTQASTLTGYHFPPLHSTPHQQQRTMRQH